MPHSAGSSLSMLAASNNLAVPATPSWNPIRLREYLGRREGKIWKRQDTLLLLQRAEEIDRLIEKLMRAAGVRIERTLQEPSQGRAAM